MDNRLTGHQQTLLIEYQEICAYHRHEDTLKWTVIGLTFAGALAIVAWCVQEATPLLGVGFLLAALLVAIGRGVYRQLHAATLIRLRRARAIEAAMTMAQHTHIHLSNPNAEDAPVQYPGGLSRRMIEGSLVVSIVLATLGVLALVSVPLLMTLTCSPPHHLWP